MFKTIRNKILFSIALVVLVTLMIERTIQYFTDMDLVENHVVEKSLISLQPIMAFASSAINGANLMKLKNEDAQVLYKANKNLLLLKMEGMSKERPKTLFAPAIPSQKVEYTYIKESKLSITEQELVEIRNKLSSKKREYYLNRSDQLLVYQLNLRDVDNGGKIYAVFYVPELEGIWMTLIRRSVLIFLIVIIIAGVIGVIIGRRISSPLVYLVSTIRQVESSHDFSKRVAITNNDEIGETALAFNKLLDSLQSIINNITENAESLSTASEELSATTKEIEKTSQHVNEGTEQSASAIYQSTTNIKELAESFKVITERINHTQTMAIEANNSAQNGTQTVESAMLAIEKIADSSQKIQGIMDVIKEIADQTNLLSLNAAIEAAKAGESGKGFAVVAEEVRSLAERSTVSTENIRELIGISTANVNEGIRIVQQTGELLSNIINQISEISIQVDSVVEEIVEQDRRTKEMTNAAEEISTISENNAAAMNQLSSSIQQVDLTAHSLSEMADSFREQMDQFKSGQNLDDE